MYEQTDETNSATDCFEPNAMMLTGRGEEGAEHHENFGNFSQTSTNLPGDNHNHNDDELPLFTSSSHHHHHQMLIDQEEISHPTKNNTTILHPHNSQDRPTTMEQSSATMGVTHYSLQDHDDLLGGFLNTTDPANSWLTPPPHQDQLEFHHDQQQQFDTTTTHHRNFFNLLNLPSTLLPNHPDSFLNTNHHHKSSIFSPFDTFLQPSTNVTTFLDPTTTLPNHNSPSSSSLFYDPSPVLPIDSALFHLNLPPPQHPPSLLRDLILQSPPLLHPHPHIDGGYFPSSAGNSGSTPLFGDGMMTVDDDEEGGGGSRMVCPDGEVFQFGGKGDHVTRRGGKRKDPKCPKNHVTERQRRQTWNDKYTHLRRLVPNPTKNDRASIVADAIDYIKELNRTVNELKILVEKKRCSAGKRVKRFINNKPTPGADEYGGNEMDDASNGDVENPNVINNSNIATAVEGSVKPDPDHPSSSLRSSWLQRKCRDTEVDVRIIDDEVTIKLVQRKKMVNCLLFVSRSLDELRLDLCHVAGGHVGDYYSFLFNTKISEGSCVYASAIANKLIEVVDKQHAVAAMIPSSTIY